MITSDQEQQVKLQFLDEATDYLDTLESGLLGLGAGKVTDKQLDAIGRTGGIVGVNFHKGFLREDGDNADPGPRFTVLHNASADIMVDLPANGIDIRPLVEEVEF